MPLSSGAALSHPNILAVYDVGTIDGVAYVVMELLEGETLRQRLNQSPGASAMPIHKVTQIGIEIAQGLAAAHDRHRRRQLVRQTQAAVKKNGGSEWSRRFSRTAC